MGLKESVSVPVSTTGKNMYCRENGNATRGAVELRAEMPNEINKIQNAGISDSRQYVMAGNSIVVDVLFHIFRKLFTDKSCESIQKKLF